MKNVALFLLDMDDVSHFYVGGKFACLILKNDWWLRNIAISPKHGFLLRFRRRVFVNIRMVLGGFLPSFQHVISPAA
jgi:hypothetical protein